MNLVTLCKESFRQVTNGLHNLRGPRQQPGNLRDFLKPPPFHDDVLDGGRVSPLPHVGRAGLVEVSVDLGGEDAKGGAALSRIVLISFGDAEAAIVSDG